MNPGGGWLVGDQLTDPTGFDRFPAILWRLSCSVDADLGIYFGFPGGLKWTHCFVP